MLDCRFVHSVMHAEIREEIPLGRTRQRRIGILPVALRYARLTRPYPKRGNGLSVLNWWVARRLNFLCLRSF